MLHNKFPIKQIRVNGLYGDRDISLEFDSHIKILVDENGSGKTTFLNLVVGLLQGDSRRLRQQYRFESIEIEFSNSELLRINGQGRLDSRKRRAYGFDTASNTLKSTKYTDLSSHTLIRVDLDDVD
ncbi:MAG: AAA family ATPase, partial [Chloroflexota bacterium]